MAALSVRGACHDVLESAPTPPLPHGDPHHGPWDDGARVEAVRLEHLGDEHLGVRTGRHVRQREIPNRVAGRDDLAHLLSGVLGGVLERDSRRFFI